MTSASQELFFLYEMAKVLASSIDLAEVTEYVLDGTCALLGAEQGFIYFLDDNDALCVQAARGLDEADLRRLAECLRPGVAERRVVGTRHPSRAEGSALATPLLARNKEQGLIGVATVYTRDFTPQEEERLAAVANLAALALENARMHDRAQRELAVLRRLIEAAQSMETGEMTREQAAEFEQALGRDEIGRLGQAFGRMAQQVLQREESLRRRVEQLSIQIDEVKKARQVAEITETEYFQQLRVKAKELRDKGLPE
ncbi:MAG: GAF domain-containing protein [Thermoflexales bacterium]|nr:GAF domain-containing protein [Thermoflexales bacterium]